MTYFCKTKQGCAEEKSGIAAFNLIIFFGFLILLVVFLMQYDGLISKDYEMRRYQKILSEQKSLAEKLEVKLTEMKSLHNLEQLSKNFNLVVIDKVRYIKSLEASMALLKNLKQ